MKLAGFQCIYFKLKKEARLYGSTLQYRALSKNHKLSLMLLKNVDILSTTQTWGEPCLAQYVMTHFVSVIIHFCAVEAIAASIEELLE